MNKKIIKWYVLGLIIILFSGSTEVLAKQKTQKGTLTTTTYFGPKKRVAVLDFEVKAPGAEGKIGSGMAEMLTTALHDTGKYIVLERKSLADMLKEQDLGKEGRIKAETKTLIGEILGAQVLIKGVVTEFCQYESIKGIGVFVKGVTLGGGGIMTGQVAVDIRMFDASTGEIIESHRTEQKANTVIVAGGVKIGEVTIGGLDFHKTPLGKATRLAIEDMVDFIVGELKVKPWEGRIVTVKEEGVIINGGTDVGIKPGDKMEVWTTGEELTDPATGLSLGVEEGQKIGAIEVTDVKEKYSVTLITTGSGFKRNDIVRMTEVSISNLK
ncbi:MAG: CsgG/HfaB family protein [bacterium]|nr:CsgG/HfaB family protein [bacterium]